MMSTYSIYRYFANPKHPRQLIDEGLTLEEAQEYCSDAESSSKTTTSPEGMARITIYGGAWFDGYEEE